MTSLVDNLRLAGRLSASLDEPDGGRLLVPHGYGRIIGLCAANSNEEFLWPGIAVIDEPFN